ncbi:MAG TPA: Smr/MutS family protein [Geminicoccus sp.]|jgi:DNA-nicking Smr family endonuclease|uniref:Smr/MutS family protein n=1 Tax=Geminicoccus sp. TaxID=2024832 RepID=UPI002E38094A|nr:Smr/MutS family protein [Geminicoccus sp.]HEX2529412.1 Smr/MutS family protein [Geminicoccus sp.]
MRRPRLPSADEAALWRNHVRDVLPLERDPALTALPVPAAPPAAVTSPGPPVEAKKQAKKTPAKQDPSASKPTPTVTVSPRPVPLPAVTRRATRRADRTGPVDIDRRSWQRLHRGEMVIESRLDLHGLTQIAAYDRLVAFIDHAWRVGSRCVLVITGRGTADVGILRTMTPRWLDEIPMRDKVLAYSQAKTHHGGAGALYVLIRRRRLD